MHASMWCTIIFINQIFVRSEMVEDYPAANDTNTKFLKNINKIANTLLFRSSPTNRSNLLNTLENKLIKGSKHFDPKSKKDLRLIIKGIKFKLLNEKYDKQMVGTNESASKENRIENMVQYELSTEIPKLELLINTKLNTSKNMKSILEDELSEFAYVNRNEHPSRRTAEKILKAVNRSTLRNKSNVTYEKFTKVKLNNKPNGLMCHDFVFRTCQDVKNMNRFKCTYKHTYIKLDKLCDGTPDCPFKSDENNCYSQVIEKILYVRQIMSNIASNKYTKCLEYDVGVSVLKKQAKMLQNILDMELNYKNNLKKLNFVIGNHNEKAAGPHFDYKKNEDQEAHHVALIISSLAFALDGAVCSNQLSFDTRRANDFFDIYLEKEFKESIGVSKNCKCDKNTCNNCTYYCKRLCRQKYSLINWNCESINGGNIVSLNVLCDGKLDCFDASDENGCNSGAGYSKFEASEMYSNILYMLQLKAFKLRQPTQKIFLLLSESITNLQKLTLKPVQKLIAIRVLRDNCFSLLRRIYSDIIKQSDVSIEPEEVYSFLLSINQKLGSALKSSHSGNKKIIEDGCHCRNGTCSVPFCSKICSKACSIEPKLTRFNCLSLNQTVALNEICDGIKNCSNGYDEANCNKDEICRRHHLVVLRNSLQRVGDNLKGTALGELLSSWKMRVTSNLKVLENLERTSPHTLKRAVETMLRDLTVTYGYVENYRRSSDYALEEFVNISQLILESVKSCRK